jgi:hypothetical protein
MFTQMIHFLSHTCAILSLPCVFESWRLCVTLFSFSLCVFAFVFIFSHSRRLAPVLSLHLHNFAWRRFVPTLSLQLRQFGGYSRLSRCTNSQFSASLPCSRLSIRRLFRALLRRYRFAFSFCFTWHLSTRNFSPPSYVYQANVDEIDIARLNR